MVNSDVKIIAVFLLVGIVMATRIVPMGRTKTIVLLLHVQKTNLCVPKEVPMLHLNASIRPNFAMVKKIARMALTKELHAVSFPFYFYISTVTET